jgi:hypothetical protein
VLTNGTSLTVDPYCEKLVGRERRKRFVGITEDLINAGFEAEE